MKTNPRRVPATQADVDKARSEGRFQGMEFMANCILWILKDKHDAPTDDLQVLAGELSYLMDSITRGYVKYSDIKRAMNEEHDVVVRFE